jgi:hypothetical protein
MLYKFKSQATGDLIMFEEHAKLILEIIGKEPNAKGILVLADMPKALAALEALSQERESVKPSKSDGAELHEEDKNWVSLRQRVAPFKQMIRQCMLEEHPIVWGV